MNPARRLVPMLAAAVLGGIAIVGIASAATADDIVIIPYDPDGSLPPMESEPLEPFVPEYPTGEFTPEFIAPSPAPFQPPVLTIDLGALDFSHTGTQGGAASTTASASPALPTSGTSSSPLLWTALARSNEPSRLVVPSTTQVLFAAANASPHATRVTITWEHGSAVVRATLVIAAGSSVNGSLDLPGVQRSGDGVLTVVAAAMGRVAHETEVHVEALASVIAPTAADLRPASGPTIAV